MSNELAIFAGSANPRLAAAIASELGEQTGACTIGRFPDGEVEVQLLDSVRRKEVFLVQPTSPPVDAHLVELLALADACRRGAAARVTAVVPYLGYSRADKRQTHPAIRGIFVTDTVALKERDWAQLHVVPVAPLIAGALERPPAGSWRRHESATFS